MMLPGLSAMFSQLKPCSTRQLLIADKTIECPVAGEKRFHRMQRALSQLLALVNPRKDIFCSISMFGICILILDVQHGFDILRQRSSV
jgi:hypothetical protein